MYNFSHIKVELIPHHTAGTMPGEVTVEVRAKYKSEEFVSREIMHLNELESHFEQYLDRVKVSMSGFIRRHFTELEK